MDWIATIGNDWMMTALWVGGLAVVFAVLVKLMPCNPGMFWANDLRAVVTDFKGYWFAFHAAGDQAGPLAGMLAAGLRLLWGGRDPDLLPA